MATQEQAHPQTTVTSRVRILTSPDGTRLWAESAGDASKPTIVFVHGLSCTALGWDKQFADPVLKKSFHLVRYEMRGHGRSGKPLDEKDYDSIRIAEDFKTVCDAFGVVRPMMAGWSLGGCIAVDVVTAYGPEYISGIIYVGGSILALHYHAPCKHPLMGELWPVIVSMTADDMSGGAEAFVDSCVKEPLPYDVKLLWMGGFIMQPRAARYWSIRRFQDHTVWERTAHKIPILIVQGKEDTHCLYENMISIARHIYDDVSVALMDGIGHSPHFENAVETNRVIANWAKRVSEGMTRQRSKL